MGIFDKFKKNDTQAKKDEKPPKKEDKRKEPAKEATMADLYQGGASKEQKSAGKADSKAAKVKKTDSGNAYRILIKPIVSEKATYLGELNKYAFEVNPKANKIEIKKAIESLYSVKPIKVNIIKNIGKVIIQGRHTGRTKNTKKAVVTLKKGDTIQIYEGI